MFLSQVNVFSEHLAGVWVVIAIHLTVEGVNLFYIDIHFVFSWHFSFFFPTYV